VRAIVEEALTLSGEARAAFLDEKCGHDRTLRDQVGRLAASCERAGEGWGFLAHPAGELVTPLLAADATVIVAPSDGPPAAFCAAVADRYLVGAELGRGGMATVYVAEDLRHQRRVAIKVLDPDLGAMLGKERFLAEIRITASLQQPNLLPLLDSGEAGGRLYYVMPLIEGGTLRARLQREPQLPVDEALRIVCAVAGALDYAHRQGVVHRDLKPENILMHDGQPLLADFGIALVAARAADTPRTAPGMSLGTPRYMSPEQATGAAVDSRSDIYSLASVLYELLVGDPPFTGSSAQTVKARVVADTPASVRTVRPSVPVHVEAALARALAKVPADRYATAREFADALVSGPIAVPVTARAPAAQRRTPIRLGLGIAAAVIVVSAAWMATRTPVAPPSRFVLSDLIDQSPGGSAVTITPDGRALVYTGSAEAGRPFVVRPLDQRPERALAGTEGARLPFVAPDGRRLAFITSGNEFRTVPMDGPAATDNAVSRILRRIFKTAQAWRYGNGAWIGNGAIVSQFGASGLVKREPGRGTLTVLTRADTAHGEALHLLPLVLPGTRAVVFTVRNRRGPGVIKGQLAIASLDPGIDSVPPHRLLGVMARCAIGFVDGWLLYTSTDGTAIMAVRLDVARGRTIGTAISVLEDEAGNLETGALADNGTLMYVRRPRTNVPVLVDAGGGVHALLAGSERSYMNPRFSPDGKRFAVQVTTPDLDLNDVWLYDIASRTALRFTTTGRAMHPEWTPDGRTIVYAISASRELVSQPVAGGAAVDSFVKTRLSFAPTVAPDGRSVVFQRGITGTNAWSIWSAPLDGAGPPRKVLDDPFNNYEPAISRDGHWLAYTSTASGHPEVYARPFPGPGRAVQVSDSGGAEPAWSKDGHQIYYRTRGALMVATVTTPALSITARRQVFKGAFLADMWHRNYDIARDGTGFLMIAQAGNPQAVVVLNWLPALRARLANAR
jgi:serine/threonine-protein kinase